MIKPLNLVPFWSDPYYEELRAYATDTLGEDFDIRAFHDEVLGKGALPLKVLDTNIRTWVKGQMDSGSSPE